ncbi:MAG: N-acetylmuramoyl-L-alanine amidase [Gaiellales bacterium]
MAAAGRSDLPLDGRVIVIDPGHHPRNAEFADRIARPVDAGTLVKACDTVGTTTRSGYTEARHNLDVARRVRAILRARGAHVVLTHNGRRPRFGPCITERATIANRLAADVALSIHADGHRGPGRGFHIIYPARIAGLTDDIARDSLVLARKIRRAFGRRTGLPRATYVGRNGLHERSDIGGLNLSDVPRVLVETANMRSATDARLLARSRFRQREAAGLADGLAAFLAPRPLPAPTG